MTTVTAMAVFAALTETEVDVCGVEAGSACLWVLRRTDNELLARSADWLIARPLKILLIIVLALIAAKLLRRGVDHFVAGVQRATVRRDVGGPRELSSLLAPAQPGVRAKLRAQTLGAVLRSLSRAVVVVIAGLTILGELEINLGPLLAGAGIVGIALGFGAQTLVRDFLAGTFMLIEDQFGVGDFIDAGPAVGEVEGVSLRVTRIRDVEGTVWHIPNGEITRVGNFSQEWARALLDVEVAHGTDLDLAQQVVKDTADAMWRSDKGATSILEEPEVWGIQQLSITGITIRLVIKTRPADQWMITRALRAAIVDAFRQAGIELPRVQVVAGGNATP